MKNLIDYIETRINESLFDDENVLSDPERDRVIVESWIKENYICDGELKINDDFIVSCKGDVVVKNRDITSLTNGVFRWGEVGGYFKCSACNNLTSLEVAPNKVGGNFGCLFCYKLKTLKGSPKEVGGNFNCSYCKNLESLEGAPKNVGGSFFCSECNDLKSLEGAPEKVEKDFYCGGCKNLKLTNSDYKKYKIEL